MTTLSSIEESGTCSWWRLIILTALLFLRPGSCLTPQQTRCGPLPCKLWTHKEMGSVCDLQTHTQTNSVNAPIWLTDKLTTCQSFYFLAPPTSLFRIDEAFHRKNNFRKSSKSSWLNPHSVNLTWVTRGGVCSQGTSLSFVPAPYRWESIYVTWSCHLVMWPG